ncbi:RusA family crossover junction endodeoxyribonuclease [Candidatus Arthromitus sp. SFB-rat-Yit]|uniref:RusA family crossover junction endodeoxyribonuclease n=1 Tax=Candidatus Arthromitus sp. SFB-rat-Yit TaxID=1041504 RepID=UPI000227A259|nr:RusA family crossover junction endodeoxyribonuclease [Candidatus Arthromitus sp. SFB-rat-Yit]BAK80775.1 endodeoxyribonuclease, RusA family protein [Candidatus Arthromitus sp. SFB-rat-Yit]
MDNIVSITVLGTPISKSNFKLNSKYGRYILPNNTGNYYDRYGIYEEHIAYEIKKKYPNLIFNTSLTAILKVFYKYEKKHPDTNNITKSICDGIEKSGIILNDSQITKLFIEEFYDRENPRFELILFENHIFDIDISIKKRSIPLNKVIYTKSKSKRISQERSDIQSNNNDLICHVCENIIKTNDFVKISNSNLILCKKCLKKTI